MVTVSRWLPGRVAVGRRPSLKPTGVWPAGAGNEGNAVSYLGGLSKQVEKGSHPLPPIGFYRKTAAELSDSSHPHKGT